MIKEFHGKRYYINLGPDPNLVEHVFIFLYQQTPIANEWWTVRVVDGDLILVCLSAPMESFRGERYSSWEKVKRYAYKLKKEANK